MRDKRCIGCHTLRMNILIRFGLALVCWAMAGTVYAFHGHKVTEGPLTLVIAPIETVTNRQAPQSVQVSLNNTGDQALSVKVELKELVDGCQPIGNAAQTVTIPARGKADARFQFVMGKDTYSAHYPAHVYAQFNQGGTSITAHAVQIFECDFPEAAASAAPVAVPVPAVGALPLTSVKTHQVIWNYFDKPEVQMPVGWQGTDPKSAANFGRAPMTRGETRSALNMHPPYRGGAGTVFAEYRLQLPAAAALKLMFYNAIRDSAPKEPVSDGVTFRVWVNRQMLFEHHTTAKVWQPGEVDLGKFAGQEITLRLESHPGPKKNTTCDSSYWGDPTIVAGAPPKLLTEAEKQSLVENVRRAALAGKSADRAVRVFELDGGARAAVALGPNGLADGAVAFADHGKAVVYDGLQLFIMSQRVGAWPSGVVVEKVEAKDAGSQWRVEHQLVMANKRFPLYADIWREGAGLRIKISSPERITDLAFANADQKAAKVYYGHGYCIANPNAFKASGGGHNLATSHVGMDFENGLSLLMASEVFPENFQVDPATRHYSIHTHPGTTFTLVPGTRGMFDCAAKYRPLFDKKPADGVAAKAGRLVYDYWGGKYADDAARMQEAYQYGVTNALLIMHVWQRWGYDYRLPDIYPPLPSLGTLADMQELGRTCDARGIRWGLHDNYIDFYPDATGFSYDHITFTEQGRPRKAWLNEGVEAQSYQFRPDHILPFVKRNLALIQSGLQPTANFVDVFTSANSFDYYDRQGQFHSRSETRQCWGEAFATIRETFGNHAPTTSEAGSDHLIGYLDGADCQWLELSTKSKPFHNVATGSDWERVPWFDAVNHTRFSLHGVGYSSRYQGDHSRFLHGIDSDDYLSAEVLSGHALMVDLGSGVRGAVRKYWLAQEFIERVAADEITSVKFAGDDLHRQIVRWQSGAVAHVNRGQADWSVAGHVLPRYGFHVKHAGGEAALERLQGAVVEWSRGRQGLYVNGRGFHPDAPLAVLPGAERVEYLGDRKFRFVANWEIKQPMEKDFSVMYNFTTPRPGRRAEYVVSGGGKPAIPTSKWAGRATTGESWTLTIPPEFPAGTYAALVGLYDSAAGKRRSRMLGDEDGNKRYRIGNLIFEGSKTNITNVRLEKLESVEGLLALNESNKTATDFGFAKTAGAFRCQAQGNTAQLVPLNAAAPFKFSLRPALLFGRAVTISRVEAVDATGKTLRPITFTSAKGELAFETAAGDFGYRVTAQP